MLNIRMLAEKKSFYRVVIYSSRDSLKADFVRKSKKDIKDFCCTILGLTNKKTIKSLNQTLSFMLHELDTGSTEVSTFWGLQ